MNIYLIRHTSVDVPAHYAYGQTDVPLRASFEEEAVKVKDSLSGLIFDKVWCSPLSRCVRLATYCGYPDAIREERLKELHFGEWEMKSWDEITADSRSKNWFADWIHTPTPGGESLNEQYQRVSSFLEEIRKSRVDNTCIFAHGGVLACARVYAGLCNLKDAFSKLPVYGEILQLSFG